MSNSEFAPDGIAHLSELECGRCGEVMLHHVVGLSAHYPLCILWFVACAECGFEAQAWEERQVPILYGGGKAQKPDKEVVDSEEE